MVRLRLNIISLLLRSCNKATFEPKFGYKDWDREKEIMKIAEDVKSLQAPAILRLNCPGFGKSASLSDGDALSLTEYKVIIVNPTSIVHLFGEDPSVIKQIDMAQAEGLTSCRLAEDQIIDRIGQQIELRSPELFQFLAEGGLLIYYLCRPFVVMSESRSMDNYAWLCGLAPDQSGESTMSEQTVRHMSTVAHGRNIDKTLATNQSQFSKYFDQVGLEWNTIIRTDFLTSGYTALALAGPKKCIAGDLIAGDKGGRVVFLPAPYSPDFDRVLIDCIKSWYADKEGLGIDNVENTAGDNESGATQEDFQVITQQAKIEIKQSAVAAIVAEQQAAQQAVDDEFERTAKRLAAESAERAAKKVAEDEFLAAVKKIADEEAAQAAKKAAEEEFLEAAKKVAEQDAERAAKKAAAEEEFLRAAKQVTDEEAARAAKQMADEEFAMAGAKALDEETKRESKKLAEAEKLAAKEDMPVLSNKNGEENHTGAKKALSKKQTSNSQKLEEYDIEPKMVSVSHRAPAEESGAELAHIAEPEHIAAQDIDTELDFTSVQIAGEVGNLENVPEWCKSYWLPGIDSLIKEVQVLRKQIKDLEKKLVSNENTISSLEGVKSTLLAGKPGDLLAGCKLVLETIGWKTEINNRSANELVLIEEDHSVAVVRVALSQGASERTELARLTETLINFWDSHGNEPKGILIACTFSDTPISARKEADFPELMIEFAKRKNICLVSTAQLISIYLDVKLGKVNPENVRQIILSTAGGLSGFSL